jgi:methionyl-tRNA formyltransferase
MRIVLVGATRFTQRCMATVLGIPGCNIAGIVTLPETFAISYAPDGVRNVLHVDLRTVAARESIPVHVMRGPMTDPILVDQFRSWQPDVILVAGWYHLVPREIREIAPALGLHASLLPDYSGGAPLVWAMINGEQKTGITLFRLGDGVDDGPILGQAEEPILESDTIATLYERIEGAGQRLLGTYLPKIAAGTAEYRLQDESKRRLFPQRKPTDGLIDWNQPARRIYDFIRAQTRPYPGAYSSYNGMTLKVWRAETCHFRAGPSACIPGQILGSISTNGGLAVQCGDSQPLSLNEVEYLGNVMSGAEFHGKIVDRRTKETGDACLGR